MTNILQLPQLSGSFSLAINSDWTDGIAFAAPGSPAAPITAVGATTANSPVVTLSTAISSTPTAGLAIGQPVYCPGVIPANAVIGAITSATQIALASASNINSPVNATLTEAEATIVFQPVPLDISGIAFRCQVRSPDGSKMYLTATTADGTMVNGGTSGVLSWNVPQATMAAKFPMPSNLSPTSLPSIAAVLDLLAIADGHTINLFQSAPAAVTVNAGVTSVS